MKTITIITPANIELTYKLAGVGARLAALIIDSILQFLAIALCGGLLFGIYRQSIRLNMPAHSATLLAVFVVLNFVIYFGYFIVCELLLNGQTIGKRLFGLRVIRDNGQPIEFAQALIRGIIRSTLDMAYIGLFTIMFSKKHKRLGDMAAGTVVVIEKYDTSFFDPVFAQEAPAFPDFLPPALDMTAAERSIVEDWLRRRDTLPERGAEIGQKIIDHFEEKELQHPSTP
jgi:uncharacterized RDD family membrane protein YckC